MPRAPNFTYQNPIGDIGSSLVRAIVGDPEAAAKQRDMQAQAALREAQRQEAEAHGGLYRSQTTGQNTANTAQTNLPQFFHTLAQAYGPQPDAPTVDSPEFGNFDTPLAMPAPLPDRGMALADVISGMAQMNGDIR